MSRCSTSPPLCSRPQCHQLDRRLMTQSLLVSLLPHNVMTATRLKTHSTGRARQLMSSASALVSRSVVHTALTMCIRRFSSMAARHCTRPCRFYSTTLIDTLLYRYTGHNRWLCRCTKTATRHPPTRIGPSH